MLKKLIVKTALLTALVWQTPVPVHAGATCSTEEECREQIEFLENRITELRYADTSAGRAATAALNWLGLREAQKIRGCHSVSACEREIQRLEQRSLQVSPDIYATTESGGTFTRVRSPTHPYADDAWWEDSSNRVIWQHVVKNGDGLPQLMTLSEARAHCQNHATDLPSINDVINLREKMLDHSRRIYRAQILPGLEEGPFWSLAQGTSGAPFDGATGQFIDDVGENDRHLVRCIIVPRTHRRLPYPPFSSGYRRSHNPRPMPPPPMPGTRRSYRPTPPPTLPGTRPHYQPAPNTHYPRRRN